MCPRSPAPDGGERCDPALDGLVLDQSGVLKDCSNQA